MEIKLKPKHFGPLHLETGEPGSFVYTAATGYQAVTGDSASKKIATPSDLIMAALASCIAISLETAARRLKVDPGTIDIVINGSKALDLPNRFGSFKAGVQLEKIDDIDLANKLLKQAKEMCTVGNTLNADISLSIGENDKTPQEDV